MKLFVTKTTIFFFSFGYKTTKELFDRQIPAYKQFITEQYIVKVTEKY